MTGRANLGSSPVTRYQRLTESFEQGTVDRIELRIVFRMPLYPEREAGGIRDPDRLDGTVFRHSLDHDTAARLENALPVKRIDPDRVTTQDRRECTARSQGDGVAIREYHLWIGVDFAVFQPRHAMVHASRQFADLRMQRAAEGDVHLLQTTADAEQRHAARHAGLR